MLLSRSYAVGETPATLGRAQQIRMQLAQQLQPRQVNLEQLYPYQQDVLLAINELDAFLTTAEPAVADGWRNYLQWDALIAEMNATPSDLDVLAKVLISFRRYRTGIELPPFQKLQQTLQAYIHEAHVINTMAGDGQYEHCLNQLATALARHEIQPNYPDAHLIGRELYCLEKSIVSGGETLQQIRNRFQHPNLYGKVDLELINRLLERDLQQETTINEVSNRRTTRGRANMSAHLTAILQPDTNQASIDLILRGQCKAPTTFTEQGQIRVRGSFLTDIEATKRMLIDKQGIRFLPANVQCSTSVQFHDISADRMLVERIARRRAPRMRPEAEADVSRQTERRIAQELDTQAEQALEEANHMFVDHFCAPNQCYGTFPELLRFSTSPDKLQVHMKSSRKWQLGAPDPPPALPENDLGFAMHESLIGNYSEGLLGGKQIIDKQWLRCLNTLTGSEPRPLWVHDRTDRWAITFADQRPIVVSFQDDLIGFTLRIKRCNRAEQQIDKLIDIAATFRIDTTSEGPVFFRQGDVSVDLVQGVPATVEDQQFLDFLYRKFSAVMPEELYFDGLVPPTGGSLAMLRKLEPDAYSFQNGWMRMGYSLVDDEAADDS
jgi:hypothetical protein